MPIRAGDIIERASIILNDEDVVRWTNKELFAWLNDGACELVIRRPAAHAIASAITLAAGTFQNLPDGALQLLDVIRNVKADGSAGRPVRRIDRLLLDDSTPTWQEMKQADAVRHYMFDEASPLTFYVYPPVKAGTKVDALHSSAPAVVATVDDQLDLDRAYIGPLVSYVLYRAFSKDSEASNGNVANLHFQAFTESLDVRNGVTNAASPNARSVV